MPLRNLAVILIAVALSLTCYLRSERSRYADAVADAMRKVRLYYVEDVEERELFEGAMRGIAEGLDRYTAYIGPEEFQTMKEGLEQEFGGVGIRVEKPDADTPLMVLSPLVDTPAYHAGLQAGDKILEIDGESTVGMTIRDAIERMRGAPGSKVRLKVQHPGDESLLEVSVTREVIHVNSVLGDERAPDGSWDYHLAENPRIGYLRVSTFGQHTVSELSKVFTETRDPPFEAAILDLRNNAGGYLNAAVETCDLFLESGPIVTTRGRGEVVRSRYDATAGLLLPRDFPLVVLVNGYSASASEIVAACLQDHDRAVVVGERTFGKGTVQDIIELEGGRSALKLTRATYWRPNGENIHRKEGDEEEDQWGVRPNEGLEVRLSEKEMERVFRQRRQRDIIHGLKYREEAEEGEAGQEPPDDREEVEAAEGVEEAEEAEEAEEVDDPQLRRAIQYLEPLLQNQQSPSRSAA